MAMLLLIHISLGLSGVAKRDSILPFNLLFNDGQVWQKPR